MNKADIYYFRNLEEILERGQKDENPRPKYKDGTPAHTLFISQVFEEYDLDKGEFPIPTLRNTATMTGIAEILWIYQLQSNSFEDAHKLGITWWDEWDIGDGTIGERYGFTVKWWGLITRLLSGLKNDPFSRRHIMNLWQEMDLRNSKGLSPCAYETIWSVRKIDEQFYLDMTLIQRSNDYLMAGYINKIQYVALQMMVARHCDYKVGKFVHYVHNLHIYDRHMEQAYELLGRKSLDIQPILTLDDDATNFYTIAKLDFKVIGAERIPKLTKPLEIAI